MDHLAKIEQIAEKETKRAFVNRELFWKRKIKSILSSLIPNSTRNALFNSYAVEVLEIPEKSISEIRGYEDKEDDSKIVEDLQET